MKKIALFMICSLLSSAAWAGVDTEVLGVFDEWSAFADKDEDGPVCYMATEPTKSQGKYTRRDHVFLIVTHRPGIKSFDVVNVSAGYTYQKNTNKKLAIPSITIDNNKPVVLKAVEDKAWALDTATDEKLVTSMKKGTRAVVKGKSARGTMTTDTFSLKGFAKAYQAINNACGRE